jgi:cystathionine beta-lyase/cystathionine gamma-synthase
MPAEGYPLVMMIHGSGGYSDEAVSRGTWRPRSATHPCTTTHRSMPEAERLEFGLTEGWVRMSVGLEGAGDLVRDVSRALDAA